MRSHYCPRRFSIAIVLSILALPALAQKIGALTIEKIMRDPKWMGISPSDPYWSEDGTKVYFSWNPDNAKNDSLYAYELNSKKIIKVSPLDRQRIPDESGKYNKAKTVKLYEKEGDLFYLDLATKQIRQLTNTVENETNPIFSSDERQVMFRRGMNLFAMSLASGEVTQLTNFIPGNKKAEPKPNDEEKWLKADQLAMFEVLKERADKKKEADKINKNNESKRPKEFFLEERNLTGISPDPAGKYIAFQVMKQAQGAKRTIVPNYVTESGFTEDIPGRTKVGAPMGSTQLFLYDVEKDTIREISTKTLPGITEQPAYLADYKKNTKDTTARATKPRSVQFMGVNWSEEGSYAVCIIRSQDNKDRWIVQIDPGILKLKVLDRLRDEAWVGGPGSYSLTWLDKETLMFQSEATGYSHLYTVNLRTGERKQLTNGKFEVQQTTLSKDKKTIYFQANEVHPGEQHWYKMAATGGERIKLTSMVGANNVTLSPDESKLLIRYSSATQPWELYLQDNQPGAKAEKITSSQTEEFKSYAWKEPQIITIKARDGQNIYARLYTPKKKNGAAVIFVHGAGYLQNA
ncbi:MAG: DPP IV N-terminal domain-containing protein, partial [Siphonobacter sp.]